ncbi:unnamed protein product [Notodromas monacha]|uniref:Uncharacterized protein n=1 Tax=Notodromas monacha TaxID=399045 RepID=A0A7R9BH85_9CRUS|nr:unnamed protein product [Notodromas monacha]CAG0915433.1 unnamed protein product [Notodromas monacha]
MHRILLVGILAILLWAANVSPAPTNGAEIDLDGSSFDFETKKVTGVTESSEREKRNYGMQQAPVQTPEININPFLPIIPPILPPFPPWWPPFPPIWPPFFPPFNPFCNFLGRILMLCI